jgi:hypothetical protein
MALHDLRVFRDGEEWWVAQSLTAMGAGWGEGAPMTTSEGVFFRKLSDDVSSRYYDIPAGWLNLLSHAAIVKAVRQAEPSRIQFPITPANAPSREEWRGDLVKDDEGLEWAHRPLILGTVLPDGGIEESPAVEFVCLDDSALTGTLRLNDADTLESLKALHGDAGLQAIVTTIKRLGGYRELPENDEVRLRRQMNR